MTEAAADRALVGPGRVAIVGAGQVGTMLGLALRAAGTAAGVHEVALFDVDASVAGRSLARGAADRTLAATEEALHAETLVLAMPVPAIVEFVEKFGPAVRPGSLLIDTGSAKLAVVEAMRRAVPEGVHAVGGHPLAGTEIPGPKGADPERLRDALFLLTPVRADAEAMARARGLVAATGARAVEIDAEDHDRAVALTSHLPHLLSFALSLVTTRTAGQPGFATGLASTGFAGATRLSASDPRMVAGFLRANADHVHGALKDFEATLAELGAAMDGDEDDLARLLAEAQSSRDIDR
jgi:prephenate dehydrogenase